MGIESHFRWDSLDSKLHFRFKVTFHQTGPGEAPNLVGIMNSPEVAVFFHFLEKWPRQPTNSICQTFSWVKFGRRTPSNKNCLIYLCMFLHTISPSIWIWLCSFLHPPKKKPCCFLSAVLQYKPFLL